MGLSGGSIEIHVGDCHCQNYDPLLDTLNMRCRIIMIEIQKGTIILTTIHVISSPTASGEPKRMSLPVRSGFSV